MAREITEVWVVRGAVGNVIAHVETEAEAAMWRFGGNTIERLPLLTPHDAAVLEAAEVQADAHGDWVACTCVEFHCAHYVAYSGKCAVTEYTVRALRAVRGSDAD